MDVLPYTYNDTFPHVQPMVQVTMKGGKEMYLCNPFTDLAVALNDNDKFIAHKVVGMKPVEVIINPTLVATVENLEGQ